MKDIREFLKEMEVLVMAAERADSLQLALDHWSVDCRGCTVDTNRKLAEKDLQIEILKKQLADANTVIEKVDTEKITSLVTTLEIKIEGLIKENERLSEEINKRDELLKNVRDFGARAGKFYENTIPSPQQVSKQFNILK